MSTTIETAGAPAAPTVTDNIRRLVPYRPGKPIEEVQRELGITKIIKLASNENAIGPSPRALEAMIACAQKMHIYPDASAHDLSLALAGLTELEPDQFVFGNGSDDLIHLLGLTFLTPGDEVIQGDPSFVRYEAAAVLNHAPCHKVPLTADWVHDLDAMADRINDHTRLIFVTNPNNPTGTIVGREALERLLDRIPERVIVALDEAYYEFAADDPDYPSGLDYVRQGRNVIVLRTFSKAYGLAGLRIGWGASRPEIASWLNRVREPFNVNYMAQQAAIAALQDDEHVRSTVALNEAGKREFYAAFDKMGLRYTPTYGNFVWVDVGQDCRAVYQGLLRRGVITRTGDIFGAPTHLRVTTGTASENAWFLNALAETLAMTSVE